MGLSDAQSCFSFVLQTEAAKIFLDDENISASSDVFSFAFLREVLSGFVKLHITDMKSLLFSFSFPSI